jgi:hypothetical protein
MAKRTKLQEVFSVTMKRQDPHVQTLVEFTYSDGHGGEVVVDGAGLRELLRAAFQAGLVRFTLHMPQEGKCVTPKHAVADWDWIECLSANAWLEEYDGDPTVYINVNVAKDAINGGLKKGDK